MNVYTFIFGGGVVILVAWVVVRIYFAEKYRHLRNLMPHSEQESDSEDLEINSKRR